MVSCRYEVVLAEIGVRASSKSSKTLVAFVVDALNLMQDRKITAVIITSAENKPIGILHIQDLLKVGAA